MKTTKPERPLYSLTVGEFIDLQRSIRNDLPPLLPNEANPPKELLTIHEAADFLNLSVHSLYTMNSRRRIPFLKMSGKVYYRRSALMAWLESGERKTIAQLRQDSERGI